MKSHLSFLLLLLLNHCLFFLPSLKIYSVVCVNSLTVMCLAVRFLAYFRLSLTNIWLDYLLRNLSTYFFEYCFGLLWSSGIPITDMWHLCIVLRTGFLFFCIFHPFYCINFTNLFSIIACLSSVVLSLSCNIFGNYKLLFYYYYFQSSSLIRNCSYFKVIIFESSDSLAPTFLLLAMWFFLLTVFLLYTLAWGPVFWYD